MSSGLLTWRNDSVQGVISEADLDPPLPIVLFKTLHHFAPDFLPAISRIPDPRDPRMTVYPIEEMFLVGILLFILKSRSRRNIKFRLGTPKFIANILNDLMRRSALNAKSALI